MKYELWYSVVVRDRHGKVLSRERRRSRSFLKQWNQLVYVQVSGADLAITDIGGTPRTIEPYSGNFNTLRIAGNTECGIVVGTGNTPVAIDDYVLETPIAEGTGVGEMNYLVCTVADYVVSAPSCSYLVSRSVVNNSLGEITVREAVIYVISWSGAPPAKYLCLTRDVFDTPQAVPIGGTITINWTKQVTA